MPDPDIATPNQPALSAQTAPSDDSETARGKTTIPVADRIVVQFRNTVSRRRFLGDAMRWGVGAGIFLAVGFGSTSTARASNCSVFGQWRPEPTSCYCASTPSCSSCASLGRCYFDRRRCNFWPTGNDEGQFCWCSANCNIGGCQGHYVCCDCWTSAPSSCQHRPNPCICSHRHC